MAILRTLLASLALLLAGGAALSAATDRFQAFTTEAARRLAVRRAPGRDSASCACKLQSGARIDLADLRGKWLLVDFIYTRCPTYCVALGSEFAQLQDRLAGPIAQGRVQLLSISFDPGHDTPPQLTAYLQRSRDRGRAGSPPAPGRPATDSGNSSERSASPSSPIGLAATRTTPRSISSIRRAGWSKSSTSATRSSSGKPCCGASADERSITAGCAIPRCIAALAVAGVARRRRSGMRSNRA